MNKTFADQIEAIASFQYHSEEAVQRIDEFILQAHSLEYIDDVDRNSLLNLLGDIKTFIIQKLALKTIGI